MRTVGDYRTTSAVCARCAIALDAADTHLTTEGEAVCRSCNVRLQLAALPRVPLVMRDGSLLLGLREWLRRIEERRFLSTLLALLVLVLCLLVGVGPWWPWRACALAGLALLFVLAYRGARKHRHVVR